MGSGKRNTGIFPILLAIFGTACCEEAPTAPSASPNSSSNTNTSVNTNTVTITITLPPGAQPVPPCPTPCPSPPTDGTNGNRTPDPPAGQILPLPAYGQSVMMEVATANPTLVATSCIATFGESGWRFMDMVVDKLRQRDTRWGYNCKRGDCANLSEDAISYHAAAGPEVVGAQGVYIIDIIESYCLTPKANWLNLGYDPAGRWSNRNRF
jgi:hypothetical protein